MKTIKGGANIVNLCWHPVVSLLPDGKYYRWEKAQKAMVARVAFKNSPVKPLSSGKFRMSAKNVNLPPEKFGVEYIVSKECLRAAKKLYPERNDLIAPGEQAPNGTDTVKYCIGWLHIID